MMRIGMVVAVKNIWIKKVRGSGLPCEMRHSRRFPFGEASKSAQRPFENLRICLFFAGAFVLVRLWCLVLNLCGVLVLAMGCFGFVSC